MQLDEYKFRTMGTKDRAILMARIDANNYSKKKRYEASAMGQFLRAANAEFPIVHKHHRHFEGKAILYYESSFKLKEDRSEFGQVVVLRLIYTLRGERGNGIALRLLATLKLIADLHGICLLAVSSPFERFTGHGDETLRECAIDFDRTQESVWSEYGEGWHLEPQRKMSKRFRGAGFQRVELDEYVGDAQKYGKHCWIYLPHICDADFKKRIGPRLIKKI